MRQTALESNCSVLIIKFFLAIFLLTIGAGCDDRERAAQAPKSPPVDEPATEQPNDAAAPVVAEHRDGAEGSTGLSASGEPQAASPADLAAGVGTPNPSSQISVDDIPGALAEASKSLQGESASADVEKAITLYRSVLSVDGGSSKAQQGVLDAERALIGFGDAALSADDLAEATRIDEILRRGPAGQSSQSEAYSEKLKMALQVRAKLQEAEALVASGRRLFPDERNAVATYREVLSLAPDNPSALEGLDNIVAAILEEATAAALGGEYDEAEQRLAEATLVGSNTDAVQNAATRIVELRQTKALQLIEQINSLIVNGDLDGATAVLEELENVSAQAEGVDDLRLRIENARIYGGLRPGQVIRDLMASGATSPALVVIPIGEFTMGSPNAEKDRKNNESPQRRVAISRAFAMARNEVTVAEFRTFVESSGYRPSSSVQSGSTVYDEKTGSMAERSGVTWQQDYVGRRASDDLPVVHVSWDDASAYARWMAEQTGKSYRLPSEAEFEYALRDGSQDRFPWGDRHPMRLVGNVTGDGDRSASKRNWVNAFRNYADGHWGPAPVGSFEPNDFGIYDLVGNVSEWVEDCWHDSYQRAPRDARAWVNPGCARRVIRGSGWSSAPDQVRSAFRINAEPDSTSARVGFRVVRGLD